MLSIIFSLISHPSASRALSSNSSSSSSSAQQRRRRREEEAEAAQRRWDVMVGTIRQLRGEDRQVMRDTGKT